jgi:hypothetical protein
MAFACRARKKATTTAMARAAGVAWAAVVHGVALLAPPTRNSGVRPYFPPCTATACPDHTIPTLHVRAHARTHIHTQTDRHMHTSGRGQRWVQDNIADEVEKDEEGNGRLWAGRGVGRGPLWVEGGEKRGQVCLRKKRRGNSTRARAIERGRGGGGERNR